MKNDLKHIAVSTWTRGFRTDHGSKGHLSPCLNLGRAVLMEKDMLECHKAGVCLEWKGKRERWKQALKKHPGMCHLQPRSEQ